MNKTVRVPARVLTQLSRVSTPTLTTIALVDYGLRNVSIRSVWPCNPDHCRFVGRAVTIRYLPLREDLVAAQHLDHRDNVVRPAIEAMTPGSVAVLDAGGRTDVGMLGGNLVMRMRMLGAAGVVTDGGMRDIPEIGGVGLPVFQAASAAPPSFTQLMAVESGSPVSCGGVPVFPGDIIVADAEGVVCLPAHTAADIAAKGEKKDHVEGYVHQRLARGEPLKGLYPPGPKVIRDYERWVADGEPPLVD